MGVATTLPLELQHLVLQHALPADAPSYTSLPERFALLRRFTLVNRAWHSFSQRLLYRDVLLPTQEQGRLFLASLEGQRKHELAAQVRTMRVGKVPWLGCTLGEMADRQEETGGEWSNEWSAGVADGFGLAELLQRCTELKELWLGAVEHVLLSTLQHAQNLEELHCLRTSVCDCDSDDESPPFRLANLRHLELYVKSLTTTVLSTVFSPASIPALAHFSYACHGEEFPDHLPLTQLSCLSTITDLSPAVAAAPLVLLDCYQIPLREALPHLPPTLLILRLNDPSPLHGTFPWLLIDHATSDELARRLPRLRELWVPESYGEWRDDPKESVRVMVQGWVRKWKQRGVEVVFEEDEDEDEDGWRGEAEVENRRLTESAAWDWTFGQLCTRAEEMARMDREAERDA
ncbi:hypothetical protein JCM1841_003194 [Sporobolomyces salmonicolor]